MALTYTVFSFEIMLKAFSLNVKNNAILHPFLNYMTSNKNNCKDIN